MGNSGARRLAEGCTAFFPFVFVTIRWLLHIKTGIMNWLFVWDEVCKFLQVLQLPEILFCGIFYKARGREDAFSGVCHQHSSGHQQYISRWVIPLYKAFSSLLISYLFIYLCWPSFKVLKNLPTSPNWITDYALVLPSIGGVDNSIKVNSWNW